MFTVPWADPANPMPWHYWGWPTLYGQDFWTLADLVVPAVLTLALCVVTGYGIVGIVAAGASLREVLQARMRRSASSEGGRYASLESTAGSAYPDDRATSPQAQHRWGLVIGQLFQSSRSRRVRFGLSRQRFVPSSRMTVVAGSRLHRKGAHQLLRGKQVHSQCLSLPRNSGAGHRLTHRNNRRVRVVLRN